MLRHRILSSIEAYGGAIGPIVLLVGLCLVLLPPLGARESNRIDENAISHRENHVVMGVNMNDFAQAYTYESPSRLVRGHRSPGTEVIVIYVNTQYDASVQLANIVTASLRHSNHLACDVQFYFVNDEEEWPVPQPYARAAIVLNLSSLNSDHFCLDMYGKHGLQPNRDLVLTILHHTQSRAQLVSLLCQTDRRYNVTDLSHLQHYLASLMEAMRLPLFPQRWHDIPTRGISTVAISSDPAGKVRMEGTGARRMRPLDRIYPGSPSDEKLASLLLEVVSSLSGLEERFHHASYVYIPTSLVSTVPFEIAQFALFAFVATLMSIGYACYQLEGFNFSPLVALGLCLTTPLASAAHSLCGVPGLVAVSIILSAAFSPARWNTTWMSINAAAIGLMEALQPATGLIGGAAVACQEIFFHPAVASSPLILTLGTCLAWSIWAAFLLLAGLPIWSTSGFSVSFVSLLIYPNAIWVSSRLVRCIRARRRIRATPQTTAGVAKKRD